MSARPSSTTRAVPVGIVDTSRSATAAETDQFDDALGLAAGVDASPPSFQVLRISPATRTLSRTVSDVNSSRRWKVRAMPRPRPLVRRQPR